MVGQIYITGQIGTSKDANGQEVKGVELVDVVEQFTTQPACEAYDVYINSPGGSVSVGDDIANFLGSMGNVNTIAVEWCASIATRIHLSVPLENRFIESTCKYMIHNPLFTNIGGNADQLTEAVKFLMNSQEELVKMYTKATGVPKAAIQGMMNSETQLDADQCVSMGFASAIIQKQEFKAVAFFNKPNDNNNDMGRIDDLIALVKNMGKPADPKAEAEAAAAAAAAAAGTPPARNAVALKMETDKGEIETPFDDVMVGDAVTLTADGSVAPDDTYTLPDGMIIVVKGGVVESITPVEGGDMETVLAALEAEKAKNADLQAKLTEQDTKIEALATSIEAMSKKDVRSVYVPPASPQAYRPQSAKPVAKSIAEQAAERKESYKKK